MYVGGCEHHVMKLGRREVFLLGAVTVISIDTGKCLDYNVLSKTCPLCTSWESRKNTDDYE